MEKEEIVMENEEKKEVDKKEKKDHKNKDKVLIEELQNKVAELTDKNMRVTAEMINTVRRKDEETSRLLKYSNEALILELLPIIDNYERALKEQSESEEIIKGFRSLSLKTNCSYSDISLFLPTSKK